MHYVNSATIFCKFVPKILSMILAGYLPRPVYITDLYYTKLCELYILYMSRINNKYSVS